MSRFLNPERGFSNECRKSNEFAEQNDSHAATGSEKHGPAHAEASVQWVGRQVLFVAFPTFVAIKIYEEPCIGANGRKNEKEKPCSAILRALISGACKIMPRNSLLPLPSILILAQTFISAPATQRFLLINMIN